MLKLDLLLDRALPQLVSTFKSLHRAPELSHYEENTAAFMAGKLRALGFKVTERFGKYENPAWICYGVVAVLENGPGPTVLYRADMDALPVEEKTGLDYASKVTMKNDDGDTVPVMHACGHDLHCTILLGIAEMMQGLEADWSGTLVLVVQPAEEAVDAGAAAMLRAGLYEKFPKPDFVLALHAAADCAVGRIRYPAEYSMASITNVDILVHGIGSHGAAPHKGKDPIVLAAHIILALQNMVSREINPIDAAVVTVGSIHGGTQRNIIPEQVFLQLTVRCYQEKVRKKILSAMERICRHLALAAGMPADRLPEVQILSYGPAVHNDPDLTLRVKQSMQQVMKENLIEPAKPIMGGEDFARYSLDGKVPAALFWLGVVDPAKMAALEKEGIPLPGAHSPLYCISPRLAVETGVKAMTAAIMDLLMP